MIVDKYAKHRVMKVKTIKDHVQRVMSRFLKRILNWE